MRNDKQHSFTNSVWLTSTFFQHHIAEELLRRDLPDSPGNKSQHQEQGQLFWTWRPYLPPMFISSLELFVLYMVSSG